MQTQTKQQLTEANQQFIQLFSSFDDEQINKVPFLDSWTPAQVAEHILKSEKGMLQALKTPGKMIDRKADARAHELRDVFLNFNTKLQSPDFIIPEQRDYNKEQLYTQLVDLASQLAATIDVVNSGEAVKDIPLGEITKEEVTYFLTYHTQRHIHQLQHISKTFSDKTKAEAATKEAIIRKVNRALENNRIEEFLSYCTNDICWNMVGSACTHSKEAIRQMMNSMTSDCPKIIVDTIFSEDEKTACTGAFTLIKKEGGEQHYQFCDIYKFAGEKIETLDAYVVEIKG